MVDITQPVKFVQGGFIGNFFVGFLFGFGFVFCFGFGVFLVGFFFGGVVIFLLAEVLFTLSLPSL